VTSNNICLKEKRGGEKGREGKGKGKKKRGRAPNIYFDFMNWNSWWGRGMFNLIYRTQ